MKTLYAVALVSLFICSPLLSPVSATTAQNDTDRAAADWLKLIDIGNYDASWQAASSLFQNAVSQADWSKTIQAVRSPLGAMSTRQLTNSQETTTLPGAPDGHYRILSYFTSFANKHSAVETLTLMQETDGSWRSAGYFIH
ncbi:DUF4019 domain-containing protein [Desulfobulbus rhabdoformis]|uniref:DUF4019 domain-containing protein n=1 Tax=Desulfobulbus rhabdoformis TaxID=34032 RepID=UPI00196351FD|nr:DUF4019 domain-containing protein [Desulfobulbus rhabdoformis]MBM9614824.1 DUF4019 domain-containing protein [Desulfobulbus rhabdoformis]